MRLRLKLTLLIMIVAGLIIGFATPVFAIDDPDTMTLNAVWVYQNCMEDDDWLVLVDYTLDYTLANPDENVTEAFFVRLMDGTDELGSTSPYAYYDDGYDRGVVAIYFTAAEASGLVWEDPGYSIQLVGNPLLTWAPGPDPPTTSLTPFDLWQDWPMETTQTALSARILWLADQLELTWGVDLIESTASGSYLTTTYGEAYFTNVVPNLNLMAPYAFSGSMIQPDFEQKEFTQDYAADLEADVAGTPLDITPLATAFALDRGMLTTILYYGCAVVFIAFLVQRYQTYKPAILMAVPLVIGGAFLGVPLIVTILAGFAALVGVGYVLFYSKSTA